jgi:DNA-binding transcriptional ArsR family regulator
MYALSKELRVQILTILCERIASPKEIADELNEGLSQVSYHVVILRECGLIVLDRKEPRRGAVEHFYRAAEPTLIPAGAWKNLPPAARTVISMDILGEFIEDVSASMRARVFDDSPGELCWTPLILDKRSVGDLGRLTREFLGSVLELQAIASKRLSKEGGKAGKATTATVFLTSFLSARSPQDGKKASARKRR